MKQGLQKLMANIDFTLLFLLIIAGLGLLSKNDTVLIAMLVLIVMKITPLNQFLPLVEKKGLWLGVIILTIGVMSPLASGKINLMDVLASLKNWQSIAAILVGIAVAWLGGEGASLLEVRPMYVPELLIGTIIGVAVFNGVPVGPLIAAGLLSLLVRWS